MVDDYPWAIEAFDEIYITYTTLLVMSDRYEEAIEYLEKAYDICLYLGLQQAQGKILLMSISLKLLLQDETIFGNKEMKDMILIDLQEIFDSQLCTSRLG